MPIMTVIMYLEKVNTCSVQKAVDSILSQTVPDFELLIVGEKEYAEFAGSISDSRVLFIENRGSKAEGLSVALQKSSGKYIARMDGNGFAKPERFEKQLGILKSSSEVGLVGCWFESVDKNGRVLETHEPEVEHESIARNILNSNCFANGSVMFRRVYAEQAGGYNKCLLFFPDYDLWLRIGAISKMTSVDAYLYRHEKTRNILQTAALYINNLGITTDREFSMRRLNKLLYAVRCRHYHKVDLDVYTAKTAEKNKIRADFIEKSVNPLNSAANSLAAYPYSDLLYYSFIKCFDEAKYGMSHDLYEELSLFLNKIRCLRFPYCACYFDRSSEIFSRMKNDYLAFLCDLKSLNNEPNSRFVYNRVKKYIENPYKPEIALEKKESCMVSIIMPTYNRGKTIAESINSVLKQTFRDFELVIINDGGNDDVEKTVNEIGSKHIRYFKIGHEGLQGALNAGLQRARGKYIAYLDDDDVFLPTHLEKLVKLIEAEQAGLVYSKSMIVKGRYDGGNFVRERDAGTYSEPYTRKKMHAGCILTPLNVLHLRSALSKTGGFNKYLPWSMDWDLWVRFSDTVPIKFLDEFTGEYRATGQNMTVRKAYKAIFYQCILSNLYMSDNGLSILTSSAQKLNDVEAFNKYSDKILEDLRILSKEQVRNLLIANAASGKGLLSPLASALIEYNSGLFVKAVLTSRKLFFKYIFTKIFVNAIWNMMSTKSPEERQY